MSQVEALIPLALFNKIKILSAAQGASPEDLIVEILESGISGLEIALSYKASKKAKSSKYAPRRRARCRSQVLDSAKNSMIEQLGVLHLIKRFREGEAISAADPMIAAIHGKVQENASAVWAVLHVSPGKKASGTLRNLLRAVGWTLERAGRVKTRGGDRGALLYRASPMPLFDEVDKGAPALGMGVK